MLILKVDRSGAVPAFRQIVDRVIELIDSGSLENGNRLPPTRTLARRIGVHRSTVLRAYGELAALGYLDSRPGSYSTVRRRARPVVALASARESLIDWRRSAWAQRAGAGDMPGWVPPPRTADRSVIDLAMLSADPGLIPLDDLRRCVRAVLARPTRTLLDYGDPAGYAGLREVLVHRMRVHGIDVSSDEVIVTSGAQQALDLVVRLLATAGDDIVVESPTYAAALGLFRVQGLAIESVRMQPDGMDLDELDAALGKRRPKLIYTMPAFHNPTGITTGQAHRERLLELCEAHRVPLVEDGFEEDLKYFGKTALPVKSMDHRGVVVYVGTFSKVVFPGLRIGWIAAPRECTRRLIAIQKLSSLGGSMLAQAAMARFCERGLYDAYLRRIHAKYRRRMQALLQGLAAHMPEGVEWTRPNGGCTLLLTLNGAAAGERELFERFLANGVRVEPGRPFFAVPPVAPCFRLSIACAEEAAIEEGCRRMGRTLRAVKAVSTP